MSDKKREKRHEKITDTMKVHAPKSNRAETYTDMLEMQMDETIASVVKAETYPNGDTNCGCPGGSCQGDKEHSGCGCGTKHGDHHEHKHNKKKVDNKKAPEYQEPGPDERFTQDAYTVAQNFMDRTQFPLG